MAASEPTATTLAGEPVELYADRALYWPRRRRLLIADLHLGKADVFRRAGIGLPRGGTSHDLDRLSHLIDRSGAEELCILGDVLHGPSHDTAWQDSWRQWRARHGGLRVSALIGNHDRALARAELGIELLGESVDDPPFALRRSRIRRCTCCAATCTRASPPCPGWPARACRRSGCARG